MRILLQLSVGAELRSHNLAKLLIKAPDLPILVDGLGVDLQIVEVAIGEWPEGREVLTLEIRALGDTKHDMMGDRG